MAAAPPARGATGRFGARAILVFDAATCAASGLIVAVGAPAVADLLDVDRAWVLGTGVFLVAYAVGLWALARSSPAVQRHGLAITAVGDALWVLGSAALVVTGAFSAAGNALVLAVAAVVAAIGAAKLSNVCAVEVSRCGAITAQTSGPQAANRSW